MRTIGVAQRALDLMITRVTDPTRKTFGKQLSEHGVVVAKVAESRMEIEQARLLVLVAAMQVSKLSIYGKAPNLMTMVIPSD
jgi:acyl-CoA dehydrogenase